MQINANLRSKISSSPLFIATTAIAALTMTVQASADHNLAVTRKQSLPIHNG